MASRRTGEPVWRPETPRRGGASIPAFFQDAYARVRARLDDRSTRPITIALLAVAGLLVLGLAYWIVLLAELPSSEELQRTRFEQATIVFAAGGEELTRYQDKNRTWVVLDDISPEVVKALVATEDHRFYGHMGVDVPRMIGSMFRTIAGDAQGGSTITMQLARNAFSDISDDMVLTRKVKEWITAVRLEAMYEKEEILEMYLNTVPFMYNAFGIEAAAHTYFQKPASELGLLESATLVGMLKGTVLYNPVRNPERSLERRNVVLQQMVKHAALDESRYAEVKERPTPLKFKRLSRADDLAPYFTEYLRQWLDEWAEQRGYNLYTDGLRVHTTIDARLQQAAEEAVQETGEALQAVADVEWSSASVPYFSANANAYKSYRDRVRPFAYLWASKPELLRSFIRQSDRFRAALRGGGDSTAVMDSLRANTAFMDSLTTARRRLETSFLALDPKTGAVRAWVGGRDFGEAQYDHVAQAKRQPGSTFKPFVYAAALESGYSSNDRLRDEVVEYVDPDTRRRWRPQNAGSSSGELLTLRDALAYSKNTITAQLVLDMGPQRVVDYAHRMGIRSELKAWPSIGLGTSEVTLLELASAYLPIADGGTYHEPLIVTRIEDQEGNLIQNFSPSSRRVLNDDTAYELVDMMRGVVEFGTGQRIRHLFGATGDLAGKTGTTQGGADGWFMLLHPNLVVGSWVGFSTPSIAFRSNYWGQGAHNALHVVGSFYRQARRNAPDILDADATFPQPAGYRPRPAATRDTLMYAVDTGSDSLMRFYDAYYDSLRAATDAMTADSGLEGLDDLRRDIAATEDEVFSEADSLNRLERERAGRRVREPQGRRRDTTAQRPRRPVTRPSEPRPSEPELPQPDAPPAETLSTPTPKPPPDTSGAPAKAKPPPGADKPKEEKPSEKKEAAKADTSGTGNGT